MKELLTDLENEPANSQTLDYTHLTVMTQSFGTDRSVQTVQTQIRLLLEEQPDQGLNCLLFHLNHFNKNPKVWPLCLNLRYITEFFWRLKIKELYSNIACNSTRYVPPMFSVRSGHTVQTQISVPLVAV